MLIQKTGNAVLCCDKGLCEFRIRQLPDDHEQGHVVFDHRGEFIGFITDTPIVGDRDPTALADYFKPILVRAVGFEVICVPLHAEAGGGQDCWKTFPEIAVRKENAIQAARS